NRLYPVLYMHDGQNCFEAFAADSYAGSWKADQTADRLIGSGRMRACIIVGVGNGGDARIAEYLPPYATYQLPAKKKKKKKGSRKRANARKAASFTPPPIVGRAHKTAVYYRDEIAAYMRRHYRVDHRREQTATCGSSMGGLLSTYLAWEFPEFARQHAMLSPAYWLTRTPAGKLEAVERLRHGSPRDVRLWLDSGTQDAPGRGDDGWPETAAARDALLANGYRIGPDFQYFRDEGACHRESDWAARLHRVFEFLFPVEVRY
ncbi:MAG: alpha/beta hydrolase, partial [Anaerolineae bacterium]